MSETCAHLYYQKQVYLQGTYLLSSINTPIQCSFTKPVKMISGSYDQDTEKLAQTALIFSDELSHKTPSEGVIVKSCQSFPCTAANSVEENIYESSEHYLAFPWTMSSGWNLDKTSIVEFSIQFGNPHRTAFIWGMVFLNNQFKIPFKFSLKIKYFKDVENGAYTPAESLSPDKMENNKLNIEINPDDLEDSGVYRFKDPEDPKKPLMFVASKVYITLNSGPTLLNFDFIGTYYEFDTAVDGKHTNDKDDSWNDPILGQYFIKGN